MQSRTYSIEGQSRSPDRSRVDETIGDYQQLTNDKKGRNQQMSRTHVHGYYMPKEYRKNKVRHEYESNFKLGHDQGNYFMSSARYNDLGELSAQYKAIRE